MLSLGSVGFENIQKTTIPMRSAVYGKPIYIQFSLVADGKAGN